MVNNKKHQYILDELIALKLYTDTNDYQSNLRRSHWNISSIKTKQLFYVWSLQLFKAALFHSVPIPRWTIQSKKPNKYGQEQSLLNNTLNTKILDENDSFIAMNDGIKAAITAHISPSITSSLVQLNDNNNNILIKEKFNKTYQEILEENKKVYDESVEWNDGQLMMMMNIIMI